MEVQLVAVEEVVEEVVVPMVLVALVPVGLIMRQVVQVVRAVMEEQEVYWAMEEVLLSLFMPMEVQEL